LLLGVLAVSVTVRPERLRPSSDLLDRLSGVAAQATTALQNGHLLDQITHRATHDELTGLANRTQLTERCKEAVELARERSQMLTLFYIDLDRFKPVNDDLGHGIGDKLLVVVGERLKRCTRSGEIVARLGGDEFAVLMSAHASDRDADALAERLARAFRRPFAVDGRQLEVGASIGRAAFPDDASTPEDLLRVADTTMFEAKRVRRLS
jgi:diguanylate cyclase (GGDEF)-like protein